MASRMTPPRKLGGLKAPSVHVSPARPPAPASATGSSSSGSGIPSATGRAPRAASLSLLQQAEGANKSGLRMRTSSGMSRTSQGNQPQHDDADEVSSNDGGYKTGNGMTRPAPLQRAATTSALPSRATASVPLQMPGLDAAIGLPSTKTDNIRVVLRIRPPRPPGSGGDDDQYEDHGNNQFGSATRSCLDVTPDGTGVIIGPGSMQEKRYMFDRVFGDECNQEDIFQDAGLMAVENTLNGFNGCIFAYGQTGSGKTFTMLGGGDAGSGGQYDAHELKVSPLRGLMPRIFDHLIRRLEDLVADESNDLEYTLSCSYLEIYNEKIFDLLEIGAATAQPKSLREDSIKKEVYVDQLRQIPIKSAAEAIEWLQVGSRNRRMASTDMNRESSRSHAVFTIRLVQTHHTDRGVLITRRSNLHLVDLAGSEKQRQTKAAGQRLKEAAQINKSLSALGNVIMALVDVSNGLKRHVHYRDSKLTFLLRDSLGGNSITTIIGTISGEEKYFSETLSTLKFAQRAKFIKNKAIQNEDSDAIIPLLKEEIERLRLEIASIKKASANAQPLEAVPTMRQDHADQQYQSYGYIPQPPPPRVNKWEPALEMMERLLKASGAAGPEHPGVEEDVQVLELRCQRLEMLLYRMICRFEEQKMATFSGSSASSNARPRVPQPPQPTISRAPSMLRKPKIRIKRDENQDDDARSTSSNTTNTTNNNADLELELSEQASRNAELVAENGLLRMEVAEWIEWKSMDERQHMNMGAAPEQQPAIENASANAVELHAMLEQRQRHEELLEAYRTLVSDLGASLQDKRDSTGSISNFAEDQSVSGMSFADDDSESVSSEADLPVDIEEVDVFSTEREIRRIQNVAIKLGGKIEKYQVKIQDLKSNLDAARDELETATEAATYAESQLEKFRNAASNQDELGAELNGLRTGYRRISLENEELKESLAKSQQELQDAKARFQETDVEHRQLVEKLQQKYREIESTLAASVKRYEHQVAAQEKELEDFRARVGNPTNKAEEDKDTQLITALRRVRELEEQQEDRLRTSSIVASPDEDFLPTDPRSRAQSTPVTLITAENASKIDDMSYQQLVHTLNLTTELYADTTKTNRELKKEKEQLEEQHRCEVQRLREENSSLSKKLDEMQKLAVRSISPTTHAKQKAETDALITRLRAERDSFRNKLSLSQRQVTNLEDQLSRSQSVNATRRSIPSDFLYEM